MQEVSRLGDRDHLSRRLGMEMPEVTPQRISARIPVEGNTDADGFLHGGATVALAETLASVGGWAQDTSKLAMGIEIKVNHISRPRSGWVTGVATPLRVGRSISFWEIRVTGDDGELVAFSTCTIAIREPRSSSG